MTLIPYRKHVPFIPIDGTVCITCHSPSNDYSKHLKLIGYDEKTGELIWEGDKIRKVKRL